MGFIFKTVIMLAGNGIGLYLASRYVPGFNAPTELLELLIAAFVLTVINLFVRPIIKLVLSPLILLTLGLASILVNLATLYLLDYLLSSVTITGLIPLILATLVLGVINFVAHIITKII